jgi:hypothetical protein
MQNQNQKKEEYIEEKYIEEENNYKKEIQIFKKEIQNYIDIKLSRINLSYNNNIKQKQKRKVRYQDYLDLESKPYKRSIEVYDIVIQYFLFMLKNFDNRLMREIINDLFVQYVEELIPNSFDTYCTFKDETENHQKILKDILIQQRKKAEDDESSEDDRKIKKKKFYDKTIIFEFFKVV